MIFMDAIGCASTRMQRPIRQPHTPRFIVRWASGRHKWRPEAITFFYRPDAVTPVSFVHRFQFRPQNDQPRAVRHRLCGATLLLPKTKHQFRHG